VLTGSLVSSGTTAATVVPPVAAGTRSATYASAFDNRFQNAIAYVSPTMSGLTAIVGYVANEGKLGGAGAINPSAWDLGLKYANGPILAGLSHADVKLRNIGVDTHAQDTRLVASYDFGMASARFLWDSTKVSLTGADAKQNVWGLGGTFNVSSNGKIIGQYYKANDLSGSLGAANTGAKFFELGYEHSLSKRTMVKSVYANLNNDSAAAYEFGVNGTGLSSANATLSGLQVGLRHTF